MNKDMTLTIERIEMNRSSINIDEKNYAFANHYESERKQIFFKHFKKNNINYRPLPLGKHITISQEDCDYF